MTSSADISVLYQEFTEALTEVLAESSVGPARRGRLARAQPSKSIRSTPSMSISLQSRVHFRNGKLSKTWGVRTDFVVGPVRQCTQKCRQKTISVLPLDRASHGWKLIFRPTACFGDLLHGFE